MKDLMPELSIHLLGSVEIRWQGRALPKLRSRKAQALLAYLAAEANRSHRREMLMTLLWPELPSVSAQTNLRQILYQLRQAIPDAVDQAKPNLADSPFLLADRQQVQINPAYPCQVDLIRFNRLIDEDSIMAKQEAASLYRGEFLADLFLPDSSEFEDWTATIRADCRRRASDALESLSQHFLNQGEYSEAETFARQNLKIDDLNEAALRQLMIVLARSGRRNAALEHFGALQQRLENELAVPPSLETKTLYEAIQAGEVQAEEKQPIPLRPEVGSPVLSGESDRQGPEGTGLPAQITPFIGRKSELQRLDELLAEPKVRLVTVLGPGGIGKTRLAIAAGERQSGRLALKGKDTDSSDGIEPAGPLFPDGVYFVSLASLTSGEQIIPTLAEAVNYRLHTFHESSRQSVSPASAGTPRQQILDFLSEKRMLLIMDNFEHLLEGSELLLEMLRVAPGLKFLVTSRRLLLVQGEHRFPLSGLAYHNGQEAGRAAPAGAELDAYELFIQRARQVRPDFNLTSEDLPELDRICRLVEGMPLGIELAAVWTSMLSLKAIADQIQQGVDFLEAELHDMASRHHSIRAVFDGTWDQLGEGERLAFMQMSVFRGSFTLEAAQQVVGQGSDRPLSLQTISKLASHSIVQYEADRDGYRIHELLRQYAAEKLEEDEALEEAVRDRHAAYYGGLLLPRESVASREKRKSPGIGHWQAILDQIDASIENVQIAWKWIVDQKQYKRTDATLDSLCQYYLSRGRVQDGLNICQEITGLVKEDASGLGRRLTIKSLAWSGTFGGLIGYSEHAEQQLRHSLALTKNLGEQELEIKALQAPILLRLGRILPASRRQESRQLLEESIRLSREAADVWTEASAYHTLAEQEWLLGRYSISRRLTQNALSIYRQLEETGYIALNLFELSWTAMWTGDLAEARSLLNECMALYKVIGDEVILTHGLMVLSTIHTLSGEFDDAYIWQWEAQEGYQKLGRHWNAKHTYLNLAYLDIHRGRFEQGQVQIESMIDGLQQEIGVEPPFGYACVVRGMAALAMKEYSRAETILQEGLAIHQLNKQVSDIAGAHAFLALAHLWLGNGKSAQENALQAIRVSLDIQAWIPMAEALPAIILLLAEEGANPDNSLTSQKWILAQRLRGLAQNYPYARESLFFKELAWDRIEMLAADMAPEGADEALAEGSELDLWPTATRLIQELAALGWGSKAE